MHRMMQAAIRVASLAVADREVAYQAWDSLEPHSPEQRERWDRYQTAKAEELHALRALLLMGQAVMVAENGRRDASLEAQLEASVAAAKATRKARPR